MKILVIAVLVAIIISLGSALFQLIKQEKSKRIVYILATRVALSIALFITLMVLYKLGLINDHIE